jgi:hypothetical protein
MARRSVLLCVGLVILQGSACGQAQEQQSQEQQATDQQSTNPLAQTPRQLSQADLNYLEIKMQQKLDAAIRTLSNKIDNLAPQNQATPEANPNDNLETVKPVNSLEDRVATLEADLRAMQTAQNNHASTLSQIAMQGEDGRYHWQFDTNSQPAREHLRRAIESTAPELGTFVVRNRTPFQQVYIVGGYEYTIQPYHEREIPVKPGTVMTRLPGKQSNTWHIGLPDFKQIVELHTRASEPRWVGY